MFAFFYNIIIYPLFQIVEFCYQFCNKFTGNAGISVLGVSFAISFLCLPLYVIAEHWQDIERKTQLKLKAGIDRIKSTFTGDEQYMMLSAYYRENHYHPMMALRSSISLLIQVPFFMAAYSYLSHLPDLQGTSFLFIRDLGKGDALFYIGSLPVNVLPIAMTLINIVAGAVYTKGFALKDKLQIYLMALVFLLVLYDSPSGLVLYWTMNNVFSLVKNIFYKCKNPLIVLYRLLLVFSLLAFLYVAFVYDGSFRSKVAVFAFLFLIDISPLIIKATNFLLDGILSPVVRQKRTRTGLFIASSIFLALISGLLLPSSLISSSPMEFSFVDDIASPFYFLRISLWQGIGFCLFWPACIYFLYKEKVQTLLTVWQLLLCLFSVINAFVFTGNYGAISTTFLFDKFYTPSLPAVVLNLSVLLVAAVALIFLLRFQAKKILPAVSVLAFALLAAGIINSVKIMQGYNDLKSMREKGGDHYSQSASLKPIFHFSKSQKNVLVIMLDRAISGYIPQIFKDKPDLFESYDGFTYYPNTISFGMYTLFGAPALYGGYEYTPFQMNLRSSEPLAKKHNESLLVMPLLFDKEGFSVTLTDPTWANYRIVPDLSIYSPYPQLDVHLTINHYTNLWKQMQKEPFTIVKVSKLIQRNMILLSLFRSVSPVIRQAVYKTGDWWGSEKFIQNGSNAIDNYAVLDFLPQLTDTASEKPAFISFVNELTHTPQYLSYPDYKPTDREVTEFGDGPFVKEAHFHVNSAAIRELGKYFDYLKEIGVYDNTRIIIVSDHGRDVDAGIVPDQKEAGLPFEIEYVNPLLMVKDFDSHGFKTDQTFMTNADVPALAADGLIENPVNVFTGKKISSEPKNEKIFIAYSHGWEPEKNNKNTFRLSDNQWFTVKDSIFDIKNWKQESPEF